ncbi:MAG TPA: hypothetical protein VHF69_11080, partial [Candidatus Synoicihabitans sp.]|nr:hypothetical protein [Candidatus Synoicihabitans sp.]
DIVLRAANAAGAPFDISLNGSLSGAGGFTKTGDGILTLGGTSNFAGRVAVSAGTLRLNGSLTHGGGHIALENAILDGNGSSVKPVHLGAGGTIAPVGTLSISGLTWHGGGRVALDIATGEKLALSGMLLRGDPGSLTFDLSESVPLAPGSVHTLVTFTSSDVTESDLSYVGLPGMVGKFIINPNRIDLVVVPAGPTAQYDLWMIEQALPAGQDGLTDDPDGDGLSNALEFALALDPKGAGGDGSAVTTMTEGGLEYPAFRYVRRQELGGLSLLVQVAATPAFMADLGAVEVATTPRDDGTVEVQVRSAVSLAEQPRQFFRLVAEIPAAQ